MQVRGDKNETREEQKKREQEAGDFSKFNISEETQKNLTSNGIKYLFPIQQLSYDAIHSRKDLIGKDRTGSGKTLAFCLPVLERMREQDYFKSSKLGQKPFVMVVVPTRELAIQVEREFNRFKNNSREFRPLAMYGGTNISDQTSYLRSGVDIVIGTPGRIIDHIDRGNLRFEDLETLILDETDEMLNIGFQHDIEYMIESIEKSFKTVEKERSELQIILFSATVPKWVDQVSRKFMKKDKVFVDLVKEGFNRTSETVKHLCMQFPSQSQKLNTISDLVMVYGGAHSRTIIFTDTKGKYLNSYRIIIQFLIKISLII